MPSLEQFASTIRTEFIEGSCIDIALFESAVSIAPDQKMLPGGEVETPIHDALNWKYTRFGHRIRESMFAALLLNEDGSTWQAKLSTPRLDNKGKFQKYETPVGAGSRAYLPEIPAHLRLKISDRYGVEVPLTGSFWSWLETAKVPIVWTEGAKKALCLLSQGYVAIALYGVNGGYRKLIDGSRVLASDVARFSQSDRIHYLAFDQDEKLEVRRRVAIALYRFSALLEQANGRVNVLLWDGAAGKGVDDFIFNSSVEAFEAVYVSALSLLHWKIRERLLSQLTYSPNIRLHSADLSTLELASLPESGIIAISSGKGTGKTKFISSFVEGLESVLSATHRVALGRNLCSRLGLNWRGDIDKVGGRFLTASGYTLRVGFCVDSLLSINPENFAGCDLILDEVCQVVRHLLTSSTCAKEGKRPALLARFRELLQVARRVIVADADLDNATLAYLKELREGSEAGKLESIFLIRNDYKSEGYPVRFLDAPDRTPITAEILAAIAAANPGQVTFVATDSKGMSKAIAAAVTKLHPEKKILIINSETSGGEIERDFMQNPDRALLEGMFDVVIVSPSMATGVSVEAQGIVAQVFGVFTGASSTDADIAQALSRVRDPVQRVVWCARVGSNYSKVSRSGSALELRSHLQSSTAATVRLVRSNLREDVAGVFDAYSYAASANPHLDLFCRLAAAQNLSMMHLRDALLVRLQVEGNQVRIESCKSNPAMKVLLSEVREVQALLDAEDLVAADDLEYADLLLLEQKEALSPEEQKAIAKYYLKDFYALERLTVDDVLWDKEGRRRSELLALEVQLEKELATERTVKAIEKQVSWGKGICPWDVSTSELKRALRERLGLNELIEQMLQGWSWTKYDLDPIAQVAREFSEQIKAALHFSIHERVSDAQIVHQLLLQLGLKVAKPVWSRSVPGHEGEKLRVYTLDFSHWERVERVLDRRRLKRESFQADAGAVGSPSDVNTSILEGDPTHEQITVYTEMLLEGFNYGHEALLELYGGMPEELKESVVLRLPGVLQEILKAGLYQPQVFSQAAL